MFGRIGENIDRQAGLLDMNHNIKNKALFLKKSSQRRLLAEAERNAYETIRRFESPVFECA